MHILAHFAAAVAAISESYQIPATEFAQFDDPTVKALVCSKLVADWRHATDHGSSDEILDASGRLVMFLENHFSGQPVVDFEGLVVLVDELGNLISFHPVEI